MEKWVIQLVTLSFTSVLVMGMVPSWQFQNCHNGDTGHVALWFLLGLFLVSLSVSLSSVIYTRTTQPASLWSNQSWHLVNSLLSSSSVCQTLCVSSSSPTDIGQ